MKNFTSEDVDSFLKAMLAVVAATKDQDLHELSKKVKTWAKEATPFVKAFKIEKPFVKLLNKFVVDENSVEEEDLQAVATALKAKMKAINAETKLISKEQYQMIDRVRKVLHKDSESAFKGLMNSVHTLGDTALTSYYVPESAGNQQDHLKQAKAMVKKVLGHDNIQLNKEEAEKWKKINPEGYKKFLKVKRDITASLKTELVKLFRSTNKKLMPYKDVLNYLNSKGIVHQFPSGFVGKMDQDGKFYTTAGLVMAATPRGNITMQPQYDPELDNGTVCKGTDPVQSYFTLQWKKRGNTQKFAKVSVLEGMMEEVKAGWRKLIDSPDEEKEALGTLIELAYETSARIGSGHKGLGTSDGKTTYGISSIRCKHVTKKGSGLQIKYPAKKGVVQTFKIDGSDKWSKKVVKNVLKLMKDKEPDDRVFQIGKVLINEPMVTRTLRALGVPPGIGIHKFRHTEATKMMRDLIKGCKLKRGVKQTVAEKWIKEEAKKVGAKLGHVNGEKVTGTMALGAYIDPQLSVDFFDKLGLRKPNWLSKIVEDNKKNKD